MNQEHDQEKLLHAASAIFSNTLNGTLNLLSIGAKPKTTVEVTAGNDLKNTRQALKNGEDIAQITEKLENSPVAKRIEEKGGSVAKYSRSIIRKAKLDNIIKPQADMNRQQVQDKNLDQGQGLER